MYVIDANIFLEVELQQERKEECKEFLRKLKNGNLKAVIPDFTVDNILLIIEDNKKPGRYLKIFLESLLLYDGLYVYSVTVKDKINAADNMEKFNLDFDDSVVLQTAISNNIKEIVSFDKDFDKVKIIKRIEPSEIS